MTLASEIEPGLATAYQRSHECIEAFSFRVGPIVTIGSVLLEHFAILDLEADLAIVEDNLDKLNRKTCLDCSHNHTC